MQSPGLNLRPPRDYCTNFPTKPRWKFRLNIVDICIQPIITEWKGATIERTLQFLPTAEGPKNLWQYSSQGKAEMV